MISKKPGWPKHWTTLSPNVSVLLVRVFPAFSSCFMSSLAEHYQIKWGQERSCCNMAQMAPMIINASIFNIIRWVAWTMGQMNRQSSVWCSKYYFFHYFLQNSLQKSFQFIFLFFYKITKIKIKSFECPKSIKSI